MATSTVGLGKTYATLAAWATATSGNLNETAQCYSGSDLGGLDGVNWGSQNRVIDVAPGHQHNGQDAGTTGVAYIADVVNIGQSGASFTIRGIRIQNPATFFIVSDNDGPVTWLMENCLLIDDVSHDPFTGVSFAIFSFTEADSPPTGSVVIRNNIYIAGDNHDEGPGAAIMIQTSDIGEVLAETYNNTVICVHNGVMTVGLYNEGNGGDALTSWICSNNLVGGFALDIGGGGPTGQPPTSGQKNTTQDNSALDGGMINGATGVAIGGEVVNVVSNPTLKPTAVSRNSGATLLGFSTDAIGVTRPQGAAWDRGALELVVSAFNNVRRRRVFRFWS